MTAAQRQSHSGQAIEQMPPLLVPDVEVPARRKDLWV
jgi:hypothetical protein